MDVGGIHDEASASIKKVHKCDAKQAGQTFRHNSSNHHQNLAEAQLPFPSLQRTHTLGHLHAAQHTDD